ncbi:hypothetical protein DUNSADRAFT_2542 [Dunaliella salina]|uniref:Uncharacterized protein n=1 Tax=Dunaliella salina TaxID=3046 RepID=A0ABQ7FWA3_DUNSA|nr:hypothetical protein DUNSADRAFT_2542 [Dunaliella salina]|eukprot:KAF5826612.1 hypothetical protein DUNSADRAFT_2542 [Dunaliella salina]
MKPAVGQVNLCRMRTTSGEGLCWRDTISCMPSSLWDASTLGVVVALLSPLWDASTPGAVQVPSSAPHAVLLLAAPRNATGWTLAPAAQSPSSWCWAPWQG